MTYLLTIAVDLIVDFYDLGQVPQNIIQIFRRH